MRTLIFLAAISLIFAAVGDIEAFKKFPTVYNLVKDLKSKHSSKFTKIFKDGPVYTGDATAYGSSTNGGNCLFPKKEFYKDMMYAAINRQQYFDDLGCGMCGVAVLTKNPVKPIRFRILDQCPECAHGSLDFSDKAYYELTGQSPGRVSVTWAIIPCDVDINEYPALVEPHSDIKFQFKTGSTQWWFQVQIFNTRYPVAAVEVKVNGSFVQLSREQHNYWTKGGLMLGNGPYTFRVTLADSSVIVADGVAMAVPGDDEGDDFSSGTQKVS